MKNTKISRTLISALSLFLLTALIAMPASAEKDPYMQADDTWINLDGTVKAVSASSFELDYGDGVVTVEMDDGDRDADAYKLLPGDNVSVSGKIDDDFFETTKIEASSVYVEKLGTHFYASSVDEEDRLVTIATPLEISQLTVEGTVTEVNSEEFVIDTGLRKLRVEVEEMSYNPLDDEGYQKIQVGDRVSVAGEMDSNLFEGRELVADSVVKLYAS